MKLSTFLSLCCLAIPASAQFHYFSGFVGGGFTEPVNPIARRLDSTGWNIAAGAGVSGKHAGIMLDFMFNDVSVNQTFLNQVQAPNGSVRVWGFTLDPILHVMKEGPADFYVTGGGGIYHRTVEYTQPAVSTGIFFDPWFGYYPAPFASNQVIGSFGQYKGGVDGGVGFAVGLGQRHAQGVRRSAVSPHLHARGRDTDDSGDDRDPVVAQASVSRINQSRAGPLTRCVAVCRWRRAGPRL